MGDTLPLPIRAVLACMGVMLVLTLMAGCGIKAPPVPPEKPPLPAIKNLKAVMEDNGNAKLQWQQPGQADHVAGYLVYRSHSDPSGEDCSGCPVLFEKIGRVDRAGEISAFDFSDTVAAGATYRYKVVPVYATGAGGPDSNIVTLQVPVAQPLEQPPDVKGE